MSNPSPTDLLNSLFSSGAIIAASAVLLVCLILLVVLCVRGRVIVETSVKVEVDKR